MTTEKTTYYVHVAPMRTFSFAEELHEVEAFLDQQTDKYQGEDIVIYHDKNSVPASARRWNAETGAHDNWERL